PSSLYDALCTPVHNPGPSLGPPHPNPAQQICWAGFLGVAPPRSPCRTGAKRGFGDKQHPTARPKSETPLRTYATAGGWGGDPAVGGVVKLKMRGQHTC
ncbi:hypothetical protein, partial [Corynebacterium matruchotii]|uniref:hypothetical protein n=1 Tax=Corynebacterium matruchotii TaxID=43768 RepID=UPI003623CBE4